MEKGQGPVCVRKYQSLLRPSAKMSCKLMQNLVSRHRAERPKEAKVSLEEKKEQSLGTGIQLSLKDLRNGSDQDRIELPCF